MARPVIGMEGKRFGKLLVIKMAEESLASHLVDELIGISVGTSSNN